MPQVPNLPVNKSNVVTPKSHPKPKIELNQSKGKAEIEEKNC